MDCPHIPELGYSEFGKRLKEKIAGKRIPLSGSIELTFRCNLRCQHCYVAHGHAGLPGQAELSTAEWQRILAEIAAQGALWLLITGGEPLIRRDFEEIYLYAKKQGFLVTLFTNGTLLTERTADLLAEWRPFRVEITLYGHTQETYERVTGIPGSHARCLRGIELLLERGVPLNLKTMLMTLNKHELWQMKAFAESLGADFRFDPLLNAGLDRQSRPKHLRLSPPEVVRLDLQDPERVKEFRRFGSQFVGKPADPRYLFHCGAGLQSFHIDPYGQLSVCMMARAQEYDLRSGSFHHGWDEFLAGVRFQPPQGEYPCSRCDLISLCGQCPGWADMESGACQRPVEYLCQVAHLRAEAFGLNGYHKTVSKFDFMESVG
jgi:radical SAM protein with 4Fe4S-binding SPASM domain